MSWNSPEQAIVKSVLQDAYPEFMAKLGQHIKDPKFQAAIKLLSSFRRVTYKNLETPVTQMRPTQNEIDIDGSLKYPLTDPFTAELYLRGGIVAVAGKKIISSNDGKFVIDGHHRWSQLYCINPKAMMVSFDLSDIKNPMHALAYTQLGIAGQTGVVPVSVVKGTNLLVASKKQIYDYIARIITKPVVDVFVKILKLNPLNPIPQIQEYIWNNVNLMQLNNTPVPGAPPRSLMPQTDSAPMWPSFAPRIAEGYCEPCRR
jgi:hypothetical protein